MANEEQELDIVENGAYKNINPKPNANKGIKGLDIDNFITVEKVFAEGLEIASKNPKWSPFYSCKVKYKNEEVSFLCSQKEHDIFKEVGGIGDNIKIILVEERKVNKNNVTTLVNTLKFESA